ncbi:MAG: glycosyltransferase family 4 protein [Pseudomonadota bacterium]|nr:glycosyltransferase family 4 protein [Pseudomonadota bacterium]
MLSILFVLHSHICGGAEKHLLMLMQGLSQRGYRTAFAGPEDSWLMEQVRGSGLTGYHLPMHGMFDLWSALRLAALVQDFRADLIHSHLTRGARYAGLAGTMTGVPVVATAHSTNAGKHFGGAGRIIAVSEAVGRFLVSRGYDRRRIVIVPNGIPDIRCSTRPLPLRQNLGLSEDIQLIGVVGRFIPDKGQDIALDAMSRLRHPAHLALIGDDSTPWGREMRLRADSGAAQGRLHFLGFRDDLPVRMCELDLLVAPSRREALSLTLIESAAAGIPAIASRIGGIPEVVMDGETGILVPPDDPVGLAVAIDSLMDDPALRSRLGAAARRRYENGFTLDSMLDATEDVYRQMQPYGRSGRRTVKLKRSHPSARTSKNNLPSASAR